LKAVPNLAEKQVMTILRGKDSSEEECAEISAYAKKQSSFLESLVVDGEQEVYSYIIGLE
jgi:dihydroxyacetone kinase-like predicted kinase